MRAPYLFLIDCGFPKDTDRIMKDLTPDILPVHLMMIGERRVLLDECHFIFDVSEKPPEDFKGLSINVKELSL